MHLFETAGHLVRYTEDRGNEICATQFTLLVAFYEQLICGERGKLLARQEF